MSNRKNVLKGSTVLLLSLAYGCANPGAVGGPNATAGIGPQAGAGLISNNAGGLISNNAGGLISNNAGGLISNNAGGLISNNAGGLISNNAGGLISNNAGGLTGVVNGPAAGLISNNAGGLISNNAGGLISNNAGGLISNNAGGLISNNAGGLISNNAGGYSVLATAASATRPIAGARVAVFNERGEQISRAWVTTNEKGEYTFKNLKPSGSLLFIKAVYQEDGRQVTLMAAAPAPREAGVNKTVVLTPTTSFVAKKLNEMTRLRAVAVTAIKAEQVQEMIETLAPKMSERAIVAAVIFPADKAAQTFDFMLADGNDGKSLATILGSALSKAGAPPVVIAETPKAPLPAAPNSGSSGSDQVVEGPGLPGSGDTNSGGGTLPTPGDPAQPTPGDTNNPSPTPTATPDPLKSKVELMGTRSSFSGLAASGPALAFAGSGLFTGSASSTSALPSLNDEGKAANAVTFGADGKWYALVGDTIEIQGGRTVTLSESVAGSDLAVNNGKAYVVSEFRNVINEVDLSTGAVKLLAGAGNTQTEFADGVGVAAKFSGPSGVTFSQGALYVADSKNYVIRKVDPASGAVTTVAGIAGAYGWLDGDKNVAKFNSPKDVTADAAGNLYVADMNSHRIRKITPAGVVSTVAGNGSPGTTDGVGSAASFYFPISISTGSVGGTPVLFVGQHSGQIRVVSGW